MPIKETERSLAGMLGKHSANREEVRKTCSQNQVLQTCLQLASKFPYHSGTLPKLDSGFQVFSLKFFEISPKRTSENYDT